MEDGVVVASTKAKKELIERGEQIPRSLSTHESLLPAPAQEPAGNDVMYEPATDDAVFVGIPSLTVLERTSHIWY